MRVPFLADRRDLLLMAGALLLLPGLGLAGAGLVGLAPYPEEAAERLHLPARTAFPDATDAPLIVEDRSTSAPSSHLGHPHASRPGTMALAAFDEDPREYLSEMAALGFRRRLITPIAIDPYQASLDPALYVGYFTIETDATPIAHGGRPIRLS